MEILLYLSELLQTHKQVGVAGLGTFIKKKSPGRYDVESHTFIPPSYKLEFDTELLDQTALAEYISLKRNISLDSANYFIEEFAEKVVGELSSTNEADLDPIGKLSTRDGELIFEPKEQIAFGFEFFGLPAVNEEEVIGQKVDQVEGEDQINQSEVEEVTTDDKGSLPADEPTLEEVVEENMLEEENPGDDPVYDEISELLVAETPHKPVAIETPEDLVPEWEENDAAAEMPGAEEQISIEQPVVQAPLNNVNEVVASEPEAVQIEKEAQAGNIWNFTTSKEQEVTPKYIGEVDEGKKKDLPGYIKLLIGLAILLILVLAVYLIKPDLFDSNQTSRSTADSTNKENAATQLTADSIARADSILNAAKLTDSIADSTRALAVPAPVSVPAVPKDTVTKYEIIVASLRNKDEALRFIKQMKSKGHKTKIVDSMPGNRIKVSIASFTNETVARKERTRIAEKLKDPGIYIYTNKPKK